MRFRNALKASVGVVAVGCALGFGAAAHAMPITGTFTLQQDSGNLLNPNLLEGDVIATVVFDAVDTGIDTNLTDMVSIFNVTRLIVTDQTGFLDLDGDGFLDGDDGTGNVSALGQLGNFAFDPNGTPAGTSTVSNPFVAYFDESDPLNSVFAGLDGLLEEDAGGPPARGRFVEFSSNGVELAGSGGLTFNSDTRFGDSFAQVPEPNALALLGAGLLAFGAIRRR